MRFFFCSWILCVTEFTSVLGSSGFGLDESTTSPVNNDNIASTVYDKEFDKTISQTTVAKIFSTASTSSASTRTTKTTQSTSLYETTSAQDRRGSWQRLNNIEYYVSKAREIKNFDQSKEFCRQQGGTLAVVKTSETQIFIASLVIRDSGTPYGFFIGLKRVNNNSFAWIDNEAESYGAWHSGEPNNTDENEDCVIMGWIHEFMKNLRWRDYKCGVEKFAPTGFICQRILETTVIPTTESFTSALKTTTSKYISTEGELTTKSSTTEFFEPTSGTQQISTEESTDPILWTERPNSQTTTIGLVVGGISLLLLVVITVLGYCYRKRQSKNELLQRIQKTNLDVDDYVELHQINIEEPRSTKPVQRDPSSPTPLEDIKDRDTSTKISVRDSTYVLMTSPSIEIKSRSESNRSFVDIMLPTTNVTLTDNTTTSPEAEAYEFMSGEFEEDEKGKNLILGKTQLTSVGQEITEGCLYEIMTKGTMNESSNIDKHSNTSQSSKIHLRMDNSKKDKQMSSHILKEKGDIKNIETRENLAEGDKSNLHEDLQGKTIQKVEKIIQLPLPSIPKCGDENKTTDEYELMPYGEITFQNVPPSKADVLPPEVIMTKQNSMRIKTNDSSKIVQGSTLPTLPENTDIEIDNDIMPYGTIEYEEKSTETEESLSNKENLSNDSNKNKSVIQNMPLPAIPISDDSNLPVESRNEIYAEIQSESTIKVVSTALGSSLDKEEILEDDYTKVETPVNLGFDPGDQDVYEEIDKTTAVSRQNRKRRTIIGPKGDEYAIVTKEV
uniref:uncharacterized protein LOC120344945 n=1 Tax=Styela clava TaxID=7725 RepID=UPI00193A2E8E|nr:uncharacterized protein LOC120344945 [Styela clava]